jgi:dCMP deaminase
MDITRRVAQRATCLRRQVGAILVKDKKILTTGYNGAPAGLAHCEQVGCLRERLRIPPGERHELCRGTHGEQNAIIQAATFGVSIRGATLYSTHFPCVLCTKLLINAGVERIVYLSGYPDNLAQQIVREAGLQIYHMAGQEEVSSSDQQSLRYEEGEGGGEPDISKGTVKRGRRR